MWLAYFMPGLVLYMDGLKVGSNTPAKVVLLFPGFKKFVVAEKSKHMYHLLTSIALALKYLKQTHN